MATDYRALVAELREVLLEAATPAERRKREDMVDGELGWVLHERQIMTDAVNRLRARTEKGPIHIDTVKRVDQSATGHSDYVLKYALGCADLVLADEQAAAR
jgi:hypothetical protein